MQTYQTELKRWIKKFAYETPKIETDSEFESRLFGAVDSLLQAREEWLLGQVLPYLRAYKSALASDWGVHSVQAMNAVYIPPEQALRNAADTIEDKRKMEQQLGELIELLTPKN